ncbi:MAG: hypothetical protein LRZ93_01880 [Clostridiales bacterium]|nr:hypothetical protein [Clostridiales bacterium]
MNYNQNCRLNQVTKKTLIVGIDVSILVYMDGSVNNPAIKSELVQLC